MVEELLGEGADTNRKEISEYAADFDRESTIESLGIEAAPVVADTPATTEAAPAAGDTPATTEAAPAAGGGTTDDDDDLTVTSEEAQGEESPKELLKNAAKRVQLAKAQLEECQRDYAKACRKCGARLIMRPAWHSATNSSSFLKLVQMFKT